MHARGAVATEAPVSAPRESVSESWWRYLRIPGSSPARPDANVTWFRGVPAFLVDAAERLASFVVAGDDEATDGFSFPELSYLARYLPALGAPADPMRTQVRRWLGAFAPANAELAVETGCSVGAELRLLRAHARHVIGFDLSPAALAVARRQLDGQPVRAWRRLEGRNFSCNNNWLLPPVTNIFTAIADALEPPVHDGVADIVLALNLLDNVRDPFALLTALDRMLKPGGLLVIGSPFAWRDDLTAPEGQLGGGTIPALVEMGSPAALKALLTGQTPLLPDLHHTILATADVPWILEDHQRCRMTFDVHMLASRKQA